MSIKQRITAIIKDRKGNVLSIGRNSYIKTHPLQAHYAAKVKMPGRIFLHAEIDSIIRCKNLDDAHSMLVTRLDSKGQPLLAKPCPVCQSAIWETPIKLVDYTRGFE